MTEVVKESVSEIEDKDIEEILGGRIELKIPPLMKSILAPASDFISVARTPKISKVGTISKGKIFIPVFWRVVMGLNMEDNVPIRFNPFYSSGRRILLLEEADITIGERGRLSFQPLTNAGGWVHAVSMLKDLGLGGIRTPVAIFGLIDKTGRKRVLIVHIPDGIGGTKQEARQREAVWVKDFEVALESYWSRSGYK